MHQNKRLAITLGSTSFFSVESYISEAKDFSIALSVDGMVGVTWNRSEERPNGFPHSYSNQQWFVLPDPLARILLASIELTEDNEQEAESGRREVLTPAPHTTGHTDLPSGSAE